MSVRRARVAAVLGGVAAELRLVTCGGRFDPRTGHDEDDVVVQAVRA